MTARQQKFFEELKKDGDAVAAAVRAGYSPANARLMAQRTLSLTQARENIAAKDEVLAFFTSVMRSEETKLSERMKCAEYLARHLGLLKEREETDRRIEVVFSPETEAWTK